MDMWEYYYYWLDQWKIPIEDWQRKRIETKEYTEEPDKKASAYFITAHCENVQSELIPEEFKPIIRDYKIHMMNKWGWPEWGYKDIKHLKPEGVK